MPNIRVMPPASGTTTHTVNGRTYSSSSGNYLDVPDFDAIILLANGWTSVATGGVGATTTRPINPPKNTQFHDTTLGYVVIWDGKYWRNPSGAAV